jgi:hypothetical protein
MMTKVAKLLPVVAAVLVLAGCGTSKEFQLEHIAKDWCMTIRASQVIPVYPLTEDIQPGDIFLVRVPIDRQQEVYDDKGFLPLDNHIARLNPVGYTNFYRNSFFAEFTEALLPRHWMRPTSTNVHYWEPAPHAAFPSYSFSVRRGAGLNLAIPVQGVPVGLSLLGSDAADGSVTIKQARTMGLDILSLHQQVTGWAKTNASFLDSFGGGPDDKETNYLRIVTRVYVTGEMDVSLRDASSRSAGLDVGAAKPVNLLFPELPKNQSNAAAVVAQNYTNGWNTLNDLLQKATSATDKFAPGGSLRLAAASSRTIALREEFNPPLILGYLGFDCAIFENGKLGPPIPTHALLDRKSRLQHARVEDFHTSLTNQIALFHDIGKAYAEGDKAKQAKIRQAAKQVGLLSDTRQKDWTNRLGEAVNGNSPQIERRLQKLNDLISNL